MSSTSLSQSKIFFIFITLLLAGCSSLPSFQQPETATPTPIPTATSSPTLVPTNTPVALYHDAQDFFGNEFEITKDGHVIDKTIGKEIPGFTIIAFDEHKMMKPYKSETTWAWQRVYEFETDENFTVTGTKGDIKILPQSGLDMYAWEYIAGEFKRQKVEFIALNNSTVKFDGYSPQEVQYEIMNNSSTNPKYKVDSWQALQKMCNNLFGRRYINRHIHFTFGGMREPKDFGYALQVWGANYIPIINEDGTWTLIDTAEFAIVSLGDRNKGLLGWYGKEDKAEVRVVEGIWLDIPKYFNKYWETHEVTHDNTNVP